MRGQIGQALPFPAVLPASRAVAVGGVATACASIVNTGASAGVECGIALASPIPVATRSF